MSLNHLYLYYCCFSSAVSSSLAKSNNLCSKGLHYNIFTTCVLPPPISSNKGRVQTYLYTTFCRPTTLYVVSANVITNQPALPSTPFSPPPP